MLWLFLVPLGWSQSVTLNTPSQTSIDVDTTASGNISFTATYTLSGFNPDPNSDQFFWAFEDPAQSGVIWSGTQWTAGTSSGSVANGAAPFWSDGQWGEGSVTFSAPRSAFGLDFWDGATQRTVDISLVIYSGLPGSGSGGGGPLTTWVSNTHPVTFTDTTPIRLTLGSPSPMAPVVNAGVNGSANFTLATTVTGSNGSGSLNWAWLDPATGLYWSGTQWSSTTQYLNVATGAGFFSDVTYANDLVTASFDIPEKAGSFWDGTNRTIRLLCRWTEGGTTYPAQNQPEFTFDWNIPPAPGQCAPMGTVYESNPVVSWDAVACADSTQLLLFSGTFDQATFDANAFSETGTSRAVVLDPPGTEYHLYMRSVNGSVVGPTVDMGVIEFETPTFTYGAGPGSMDVDFGSNALVLVSLPFTTNYQDFDPNALKWSIQQDIDGTIFTYTDNGSWTTSPGGTDPGWYKVNTTVDRLFETQTITGTQVDFSFQPWTHSERFWSPQGDYADQTITVLLKYFDGSGTTFTGAAPGVTFERTGNAPDAPVMALPDGNTTDLYTPIQWQPSDGAMTYQASVTGNFDDGDEDDETYTNLSCNNETFETTFTARIGTTGNCQPVRYRVGESYNVSVTAINPMGTSAATTWSFEVVPPIGFSGDQVAPLQHAVVELCDRPVQFTHAAATVANDFDPERLKLAFHRGSAINFWNGLGWFSTVQTRLPVTETNGLWGGFSFDTNTGAIVASIPTDRFPEEFWKKDFGGTGDPYHQYGDPHWPFFAELTYDHYDPVLGQDVTIPVGTMEFHLQRFRAEKPAYVVDQTCAVFSSPYDPFTWDPVLHANAYEVTLQIKTDGVYQDVETTETTTATYAITPAITIDHRALYRIRIKARVLDCWSEAQTVFGPMQFINPGYDLNNTLPLVISDPPPKPVSAPFIWDYHQTPSVSYSYAAEDLSLTLMRDPQATNDAQWDSFDYPLLCGDVSWRFAFTIAYWDDGFSDCASDGSAAEDPVHGVTESGLKFTMTRETATDANNYRITLFRFLFDADPPEVLAQLMKPGLDPAAPGITKLLNQPGTGRMMDWLADECTRVCRNLLDNGQTCEMDGTVIPYEEKTFYLWVEYGVGINPNGCCGPIVAQTDPLAWPFKFNNASNSITSLTLEAPEPPELSVIPENTEDRVTFKMDVQVGLADSTRPIYPDYELFKLRLKAVTPNDDWTLPHYWDGIHWVAVDESITPVDYNQVTFPFGEVIGDLGSFPQSSNAFFQAITFDWKEREIRAEIPAGEFGGNFFPPLATGEECPSREVAWVMVYEGNIVEETNLPITSQPSPSLTFHEDSNFPFSGLALTAPDNQVVIPERTGTQVAFQVPLHMDQICGDSPVQPTSDLLTWSLRTTVDSQVLTWDGTAWTTVPVSFDVDPEPGSGPAFYSQTGLVIENEQPYLDAHLPSENFTEAFFEHADGNGLIALELMVRVQTAALPQVTYADANSPVAFTIQRLEDLGGLDWENSMSFLEGLDAAYAAYAPEPILRTETEDTWLVGNPGVDRDPTDFATGTALAPEEYAWLQFQNGTPNFETLFFLARYPAAKEGSRSLFSSQNRTANAIDISDLEDLKGLWTEMGHLAIRYFTDGSQKRMAVVIFLADDQPVTFGSLASLTDSDLEKTALWDQANVDVLLDQVDPSHNRILTIAHIDEMDASRKSFSVQFSDQLGRAQETRAMGTHAPTELTNTLLISGLTTVDALGRPVRAAKGFHQDFDLTGGALGNQGLGTAPHRDLTYDDATNFWKVQQGPVAPALVPFAETIYEANARGRVVASLPVGGIEAESGQHKLSTLRYTRYHYFATPAPNLVGMAGDPRFHHLPTDGGIPMLFGTLAVDPNGSVVASFTGMDPEQVLLTVANPTRTLMGTWGLDTETEDPPTLAEQLRADTVFLPQDYDARIQKNNDSGTYFSRNLTTFHQVDVHGRLIATFPPKSLTVDEQSFAIQATNNNLKTSYEYDLYDRIIQQTEADAGVTEFRYNDLGQLRFTRTPVQASRDQWTEISYDDLGREIETRIVARGAHDAEPSDEERNGTRSPRDTVEGASVKTYFDATCDASDCPLPPTSKSAWPSEALIAATYPFGTVPQFGDTQDLVAQIMGPTSAQRFVVDAKGRTIGTVTLTHDLAEPQINWVAYDPDDRVVASFNHNANQGYRYVYDAWDRLVVVHDLSPRPVRLQIAVQNGQNPAQTVKAGPLVDAAPLETESTQLARYQHTPTGHLAQAHFGNDTVAMAYSYDARDWLTSTLTSHRGIDVYQTALRYFDGVDSETALYDGTITEIVEQYGASLPAPYVLSHITHRYDYDALYQLIGSESDFWDQATDTRTASRAYIYDRNGNRRTEQRNDPEFEDGSGNIQWTLDHDHEPGTNQLVEVTKNEQPWIFGTQYDGQGNLTQLRKINPYGNRITQVLTYDDPLNPILPTTIDQTVERPGVDQEPEWVPVPEDQITMNVAYNEGGARIRKTLIRYELLNGVVVPRRPEITRYLPSGTENMTEMDAYGRTTRAYLFAADARIGFKNATATALYIKDHLGSTKATLNLYQQDATLARPFETDLALSTVHHWALDGDLKDEVTSADATLNGSGSTYLSGVKDLSLQLVGIGDYLDLGMSWLNTEDPSVFSAALWVRIDADLTATTATHSILSNRDGANGGLVLLVESHTNGTASGTLTLYTYDSGSSDFLKTTTGNHFPNDGKWHYLVLTQNGDQGTLYLDGHPVAQGTINPAATSSTTLKLGANHTGSNQYLPGTLDEITILNRPMTLGEVQKTYYVNAAALQSSFPEGGLTGFFELDGDTADASSLQPNGQIVGNPTYESGVVGDALVLDGVDDGINLGNPAGFGAQVGDFSVSLWVKLGLALDAENSLVPILSNAQNNTGMELQLKLHPDPNLNGILYFYTYQNGGYTRLWTDSGAFPDDGKWHHIAATRSGSSGKLYLDGVLLEGKTLAAPDDALAPLWLGTDPAGRAWPGSMDQVRLYDRALTSHEVLAHVLNADQRYGLWTGDGTIEDGSGNDHHGNPLGSATYEQGIKGQALSFNGSNDTVDLGNPPALSQGLTSFSVTAWVRLDKDLGTEDVDHTLMGNKDGTQGGFTIKLEDHTTTAQTGRIKVLFYNGGTTETLSGTGHHYLSDGDWHQLAFTLEGGTGTLYVDGLQIASKTMISPGDSTNALYLGSHLGSTNHWIGAMDEIQFYRRGLQAEEIQSDYLTWAPASHRQPQEDLGLTAQWDFDNDYQNQKDTQNPATPSASLSFVEGKQNDALQLDGIATVDLGTTADVTLDNGTITLWAKLESPLGTSNGRYVLLANHDADSGFRLVIDNDTDPAQAGSIQFTTYTATTTKALTSGSTHWPNDSSWHHLAVTKKAPPPACTWTAFSSPPRTPWILRIRSLTR